MLKGVLLALASAVLLAFPASGVAEASHGCSPDVSVYSHTVVTCRSWAPQAGGHKYGLYLTQRHKFKETEDGGKHWRVVFDYWKVGELMGTLDCLNDDYVVKSFERRSRTTAELHFALPCDDEPEAVITAQTATASWGCPKWDVDGAGTPGSRTVPRCLWAL